MRTFALCMGAATLLGAVLLGVRAYRDHQNGVLAAAVAYGLAGAWVSTLLLVWR